MTGFGTDEYRQALRELERSLEAHKDFVERLSLNLDAVIDKDYLQQSAAVSWQEFESVDRRLRSAHDWLSNAARHLLILAKID
jgi:hypothetical protein